MVYLYISLLQNSDDLSDFGRRVGINAPILAVCPTSEECTFHVIVEQEPTCELNRFNSALIHLVATYFIYDKTYPKPFNSVVYDPALYS